MKKGVALLLPLLLAADTSLLSTLKQKEITLKKARAILEAKKLHDSWINPINMRYLYQKGNQFPNQKLENFSISVDQPIFKSGGIIEAIRYANITKKSSLTAVEIERRSLVASVLHMLYQYRELDLAIQKQKLLIKNAKIDVTIKKEQYLSGEIDSTFLDNAILGKNQKELALLDLEQKRADLLRSLADSSDIDPDSFTLPTFTLVEKRRYLGGNLYVQKARNDEAASKHFKKMTIARYLPSFSIVGDYTYQSMRGSLYFPGYRYKDNYYTYGVKITMPLFDINSFRNIQEAKIDYLKANNAYSLAKRQKSDLYRNIVKKLSILDRRIALAKEDFSLYQKLYKDTLDRFKAGEKTKYDVAIMANAKRIRLLDQKIYRLQKQELLLDLYKEMRDAAL